MEKENTNSGSAYVSVDGHLNPVHVSMEGTGEEGFLEFMLEDVEKALKETEMPTMGMMYYNVPDMRIIPRFREGNNDDYLRRLERRWTDMGLSRIDTWLCRKWCIACESTWTRFQGTRTIPDNLHRRCGGR